MLSFELPSQVYGWLDTLNQLKKKKNLCGFIHFIQFFSFSNISSWLHSDSWDFSIKKRVESLYLHFKCRRLFSFWFYFNHFTLFIWFLLVITPIFQRNAIFKLDFTCLYLQLWHRTANLSSRFGFCRNHGLESGVLNQNRSLDFSKQRLWPCFDFCTSEFKPMFQCRSIVRVVIYVTK